MSCRKRLQAVLPWCPRLCLSLVLALVLLPGAQAAVKIYDSELFVNYLYAQFYGRPGESEGISFWRDAIDKNGESPTALVENFFFAPEYQDVVGPIARLYQAGLGRVPDSGGLNYWVGVYRSGVSLEQIATGFLQSAEFVGKFGASLSDAEFVDLLYQFVLGRPGEASGVAFWAEQLGLGASRGLVLTGFSESQENRLLTADRVRVTLLYEGLLGRQVTPDELVGAVDRDTATLIAQLLEGGSSVSIAIVGLGDGILVTDQQTVTIAGVADSSVVIEKVVWSNAASGTIGNAIGTEDWLVNLSLAQGDNPLLFTAVNRLGISAEIGTTLTYFAGLALNTPLTLSTNIAYVNESTTITFTLGLETSGSPVVTLLSANQEGGNTQELVAMADDGLLPDEIQGDGIYTVSRTILPWQTGYECFRARVANSFGEVYLSETACVWVTERFTQSDVSEAANLADQVEALFAQASPNTPLDQVAQQAVALLLSQAGIAVSGSTETGSVWWVTSAGILGAYHPVLPGQRGGSRAVAAAAQRPTGTPPAQTANYPAAYLLDRSTWRPGSSVDSLQEARSWGTLASAKENRIRSTRALLVSPYIANPNEPQNSFGLGDDFFVPWQFMKDQQSCTLYPAKEALNNGSIGVSLNDFTDLSSFGYIHYSTHGDNYYSGLLNLWNDAWGPSDFLKGALSQVVLFTGLKLPKNLDGSFNFGTFEDDIKAKRIAISAGGSIALTPAYFDHYVGNLPNSLVVLAACRTLYNNSLANVFLKKGAATVLGYTDYVLSSYAQKTTKSVLEEMLSDRTVGEGFAAAVASHGSSDGGSTPAFFRRVGAADLKLSDGGFANLGFEDGTLTPWRREGDGRIITQLGSTRPVEGNYMGIISTGLGFSVESGSLAQSGCLAPTTNKLTFSWNFFSEEFPEFCGSIFQDAFTVQMCEIGDNNVPSNCSTLFETFIDALCGTTTPVDIGFDIGGVEATGWRSSTVDIAPYAGKRVELKLNVTDVGDSIFDSAVLLDAIQVDP